VSRARTRPSREETRERLFRAAATVFVRVGIGNASVEDICEEAGLTRGALYSNFANKDELVMAMLDDHLDRGLAELERLMDVAANVEEYLHLIESAERRREDPLSTSQVLHMEFLLYAVRDPRNRPRLAQRQQRWRELIASVVRADFAASERDLPFSPEAAAAMIAALDDGYALHELVEPGSYAPGTFSETLLALRRMWIRDGNAQAPRDDA
jgi:AcrR family transcriptional regulator